VALRLRTALHDPKRGLEKSKGASGHVRRVLTNRVCATVAYFPDGCAGSFHAFSPWYTCSSEATQMGVMRHLLTDGVHATVASPTAALL
jgi:hypothetical protein